jgi:hypothetical protein
MTTTKVAYTNWASISGVTALDSLATGAYWVSDSVSNVTNLFTDFKLGGMLDSGGTFTAGDGADIFAIAHYDLATATDWQSGIGTALNPAAATDGDTVIVSGTDFFEDQLTRIGQINFEAINSNYHWHIPSLAKYLGSLPQEWAIVILNRGANSFGTVNIIGGVGIHHIHA